MLANRFGLESVRENALGFECGRRKEEGLIRECLGSWLEQRCGRIRLGMFGGFGRSVELVHRYEMNRWRIGCFGWENRIWGERASKSRIDGR